MRIIKRTFAPLSVLMGMLAGVAFGQNITVSPQQLTFNVAPGVQSSALQGVTITPDAAAANGPVNFAVSQASPWLFVNGTSSGQLSNIPLAGANLSVNVSTQNLVAGQLYNGSFSVQIPSVPASQKVVNVNLFAG